MANQEAGVGVSAQPSPGQHPKPQTIDAPTARGALRVERAAARSMADQKRAKKDAKARQDREAKSPKKTLKEQEKALKKAMKKAKKSREKASVRYDDEMTRDKAVAYLETILKGLKKGALRLRAGGETVVISPSDPLIVAMKAKARQKKESVAIRLSWRPRNREK